MLGIHNHILFDILLYLPVISLLRFKSVCKSWLELIESSDFIKEHLKYNGGKEDNLIVLNHIWNFEPNKSVVELVLHSGSHYENNTHIDFDRLRWHPLNSNILLSGSCNGIIFLQQRGTLSFALWNPALHQLRPLPLPLFSNTSVNSTPLFCGYGASGIDIGTDDLKVLKIFPIITEEHEISGNQVEVYSLRDNYWRIIHENVVLPILQSCDIDVPPLCCNGKCFWIQRHCQSPNIITFDFTDEVFGEMSLPDGEYDHGSDSCNLDTCNGKIIYIRIRDDHDSLKLEIWMLCEGGLNDSWTRAYMAELYQPYLGMIIYPINLLKNGEYFVCITHHRRIPRRLYLCNLHTQEEKKCIGFYPTEIVRYNPSLISVESASEI